MRVRMSVAAALLLFLLVAPACSKDGDPSADQKSPAPGAPAPAKAGFRAVSVQAVDPADRPQANEKATQVAAKVVELVNAYYSIAFIEPGKWRDGTHPEIVGVFLPELRDQVGGQLQGLALGDLAPKLSSVDPDKEEVDVRVYVTGNELATPAVRVTTLFEATAEAKDEADGPVKITHRLSALLVPEGDGFKVAGGTAELRADTAAGALGPRHATASWGVAG